MKVLHALNYHRASWGSDRAWVKTIELSRGSGLDVAVFSRDSRLLPPGLAGKAKAFFSGMYAPEGIAGFEQALAEHRPDVVQTHELYPLVSPWILRSCKAAGIPVVHTCYDYRLTCPIATHFTNGAVCRRCMGGKEYWAVVNNCRENLPESLGYGLRNAVARGANLFDPGFLHFIVPTEYGQRWLMTDVGVAADRITVQPCFIAAPETGVDPGNGAYIAYAGRFTVEKGSQLVVEAARRTGLPVRLAGNADTHPSIRPGDPVTCVATASPEALAEFYRSARMVIVPSIWEETFGVVAAEAMSHGVPVIASNIGALPFTVSDGVTGLTFETGNVDALSAAMQRLWNDRNLCRTLGAAGRHRVQTEFNETAHIRQLKLAYEAAIAAVRR